MAETGVNVSKVQAYAATTPPVGVSASKVQVYVVIVPIPTGVNISKVLIYAVLQDSGASYLALP